MGASFGNSAGIVGLMASAKVVARDVGGQRDDATSPGSAPRLKPRLKGTFRFLRIALYFLPTILAIAYYGGVAASRYVSEAQFVVRTASKPVGAGALGSFLQMSGLARTNDDAFAVESYMGSRDAVRQLLEHLPLRQIYGDSSADFIARYPSVFYGSSLEEFHRYMSSAVRTVYSSTTGITTLKVQAFQPEHAKAIADALLKLGEQMVNGMNERIHGDAIKTSVELVKDFEKRLIDAQIAITQFRNDELMIDPASSSVIVTEVVGRLTADRVAADAQINEMGLAAPNSPALVGLKRRVAALEDAIRNERSKISDEGSGLAKKLAHYERLILEREFAKTSLAGSMKGLEQARTDARRQQLYIEHVVRPNLPDYAMEPGRLAGIWTVLSLNLVGLLVGWLFMSGIRQHSAG